MEALHDCQGATGGSYCSGPDSESLGGQPAHEVHDRTAHGGQQGDRRSNRPGAVPEGFQPVHPFGHAEEMPGQKPGPDAHPQADSRQH